MRENVSSCESVQQKSGLSLVAHLIVAIARNQLKRVGLIPLVKAVLARKNRGGNPWSERDLELGLRHILELYELLLSELPADLQGRAGLEIGPGDTTALAGCFAMRGAEMHAVEKFASVHAAYTERLIKHLRPVVADGNAEVKFYNGLFEGFRSSHDFDFIYSVDVMEHVESPKEVFARVYQLLKTGGKMVHSIDLAGHQIGDLEHLCCPDWLWEFAFSHVETTKRVRLHEFVAAAQDAGFSHVSVRVLRSAEISTIRPRILERWRNLPDQELAALQILITAVK